MGLAYFIVLDNGSCTDGGRSIAHLADPLNEACLGLGLPALEDYLYIPPEDLELADGGADGSPADEPTPRAPWTEERWYEPGEGVSYFNALLGHVRTHPAPFDDPDWGPGLAEDLEECVSTLESARSRGHRWHLGIDLES